MRVSFCRLSSNLLGFNFWRLFTIWMLARGFPFRRTRLMIHQHTICTNMYELQNWAAICRNIRIHRWNSSKSTMDPCGEDCRTSVFKKSSDIEPMRNWLILEQMKPQLLSILRIPTKHWFCVFSQACISQTSKKSECMCAYTRGWCNLSIVKLYMNNLSWNVVLTQTYAIDQAQHVICRPKYGMQPERCASRHAAMWTL